MGGVAGGVGIMIVERDVLCDTPVVSGVFWKKVGNIRLACDVSRKFEKLKPSSDLVFVKERECY